MYKQQLEHTKKICPDLNGPELLHATIQQYPESLRLVDRGLIIGSISTFFATRTANKIVNDVISA